MSNAASPAKGVCGQLDVLGLSGFAASAEQDTGTSTEEAAAAGHVALPQVPAPLDFAQPEDAADAVLLAVQVAELPGSPVAAAEQPVACMELETAVPAGEAAAAAVAAVATELDTYGHDDGGCTEDQQQVRLQHQQQCLQQPEQKAAKVLGQHARQLILADLAGWFAEGQEQQRQQQLEVLAAAAAEQQRHGNNSSSTGSKKRERDGVGAAVFALGGNDSQLTASGAEQQQVTSGVCGVDTSTAAAAALAAGPIGKRPRIANDACVPTAGASEILRATGGGGVGSGNACGGSVLQQSVVLPAPVVLPGFLCALEFLGVSIS
jgi:hypothetical protein